MFYIFCLEICFGFMLLSVVVLFPGFVAFVAAAVAACVVVNSLRRLLGLRAFASPSSGPVGRFAVACVFFAFFAAWLRRPAPPHPRTLGSDPWRSTRYACEPKTSPCPTTFRFKYQRVVGQGEVFGSKGLPARLQVWHRRHFEWDQEERGPRVCCGGAGTLMRQKPPQNTTTFRLKRK